ncbi:MAG: S8 family serine peptidase, partial [Candidatus Altiarchaeota archaeon]
MISGNLSLIKGINEKAREEIMKNKSSIILTYQRPFVEYVNGKGGHVLNQFKLYNGMLISLPINEVDPFIKDSRISMVHLDAPYENVISLDHSTYAIDADVLWDDDDPGPGPSPSLEEMAVLDTGVNRTHPALWYRHDGTTNRTWHNANFTDNEDDWDYGGHGTHVAGIIASSNDTYKGMLYDIDLMMNAKIIYSNGTGYKADAMEGIEWAYEGLGSVPTAEVLSNSYGWCQYAFAGCPKPDGVLSNGEGLLARYVDSIAENDDVIFVFGAGNEGESYSIRHPGDAYNILSVGAIDDIDTSNSTHPTRTDDDIRSSSSNGPTNDSRKKPDLVAPGVDVYSTAANYAGTNADFIEMSGTSMATPHVASAALWFFDYGLEPIEVKALLINTALDCEYQDGWDCVGGDDGWDARYGWGYIDLNHAHIHLADVVSPSINAGEIDYYLINETSSDDKATLVWYRHINQYDDNTTGYSLNDLDLYAYSHSSGDEIDTSTSTVDNVEQVVLDASYSYAVYKIKAEDTFYSASSEEYAFVTEEKNNAVSPPSFTVNLNNSATVGLNTVFVVEAKITNTGDLHIHDVNVTLIVPSGFNVTSDNPDTTNRINNGNGDWTASWTVVSPDIPDDYTLQVNVKSSSYGEIIESSDSNPVEVVKCIGVDAPASG